VAPTPIRNDVPVTSKQHLRQLATLRPDGHKVLSVYLNLDPSEFPTQRDRKIEVEWASTAPAAEAYAVPLTILTEDRPGMLAEIAAAISEVRSNILNVEARTADERGTIDITVEIPDMKHLERVIASVKKIDGVYDVTRSTKAVNTAR